MGIANDLDIRDEGVAREYARVTSVIVDDPYNCEYCIGIRDVLAAHYLIADYFVDEGRNLGGVGPRDENLLHSALYRQITENNEKDIIEYRFRIMATLLFGLIMNHQFHDANKRTALLSCLYHLFTNGYFINISHKEIENFTVDIASNNIKKKSRYKKYAKKSKSPDVDYIAWFLRTNSRKIDKKEYFITFRELKKILSRFNVYLENPSHNYIEVVKYNSIRRLIGGKKEKRVVLGKIGYPGDSREVSKSDITKVRKLCGLTPSQGFTDSDIFYRDSSPLAYLLAHFEGPLRRLADR